MVIKSRKMSVAERSRYRPHLIVLPAIISLLASEATAGTYQTEDGVAVNYGLTASYGAGVRTERASDTLINGAVGRSGLPSTINMDDGNRNFDRGSLVTNRLSLLGELEVSRSGLGGVLRASSFYDEAYRRRNDNTSPATVNKTGDVSEFTSELRHLNGSRSRILDAYAFGNWQLGEASSLNLRAGKQVVAWGEGLFFPNIAAAQGTADATKGNLPGVEVKDILIPVGQVSGQLSLNSRLSLLGYVQYEHKPNELDGPGAYLNYSDMVGPGAEFLYAFANPAFGAPGAPRTVNVVRTADERARDGGQWGAGMRFRVSEFTELGFYHLNYHDKNPSLVFTAGDPVLIPGSLTLASARGMPAGTPVAPVSYRFKYFEDIKLTGASFSTSLWDASVAGEISYKKNVPVLVKVGSGPLAGGVAATPGDAAQAQVSWMRLFSPTPFWNQLTVVGEVAYLRVLDVSDFESFGRVNNELARTRNAWAYQLAVEPSYPGVFESWDMSIPIKFAHLVHGVPAVSGAFGGLVGEDDRRLSVGAKFKYLNNLEISAAYNRFLGSPDPTNRPLADRDFFALNVKYSF